MELKTILEPVEAPGIAELRVILRKSQGERIHASSTDERVDIFRKVFDDDNFDTQEQMIIMLLDTEIDLIATYPIASGTITECRADFSKIIRAAAAVNAHCVIIAHNHPEGEALPSRGDVEFANSIQHALHLARFELLDMIILTREEHFSFVENDLLIE